jgi:hypothetical protein
MYMEGFTAGEKGFKFLGKASDAISFGVYPPAYFGTSLGSGDFNGDGIIDFVFGAALSGSGSYAFGGAAYVYYGKSDGYTKDINLENFTTGSEGFIVYGSKTGSLCGRAVGNAGDVNGDGIDDVYITAPAEDAFIGDLIELAGLALIVYGTSTPFVDDIGLTTVNSNPDNYGTVGFLIGGSSREEHLGWDLSAAGDINNDGIVDMIIGAPFYGITQYAAPGKAYVLYGQTGNRMRNVDMSQFEEGVDGFSIMGSGNDKLGYTVHGGFDMNDDGVGDVAVASGLAFRGSAYYQPEVESGGAKGEVWVINGASSITEPIYADSIYEDQGFAVVGSMNGSDVGYALDSGDMNGDGIPDLLVTAPGMETDSGNNNGRSYVVYGGSTMAVPTRAPTSEGGGTSSSGSGAGSGTGAAVGGVVGVLVVLGIVAAGAYVYLMKKQNPLSAADENRASATSGEKDMVQNDQL